MAKNMYEKREQRKNKSEEEKKTTTTNINWDIRIYGNTPLNLHKY